MQAKRIFVAGAGRSGLMIKAFAMRLVHLGFEAYVVGETITPGVQGGDLFIIGSGSGETIGKLADVVITLPGSPKDKASGDYQTIQPMGPLFEQTLIVFYDAVILRLMEMRGMDSETMYGLHANLE